MKAKQTSATSMVIAAIWIAFFTILKGFKIIEMDMNDILISGFGIAGAFCPVYFSVWLDKINLIKNGGTNQ